MEPTVLQGEDMLIHAADSLTSRFARLFAVVLATSVLSPMLMVGCDNNQQASVPPPRDASSGEMARNSPGAAPPKQGMSTKQKVILLTGAAALYYLYKRNQAKVAAGQSNVQYYLSKNGRIYYRDPKTNGAIWVTPPREPIYVPADQAGDYQGLQGYNGSASGRDLTGLVPFRQ
jgi:hypothetical protein